MQRTLLLSCLSILVAGAPNQYPTYTGSHPGWNGTSVYTPLQPTQTPPYSRTQNATQTSGSSGTTTNSTSPISTGPCGSVSQLAAAQTSASGARATPTVPAELAYQCLKSIPFNQSAAVAFLDAIDPYLIWQTTLQYVKNPPAEYASKVQPAYDFDATWAAIHANTTAKGYESEYDFGWTVYRAAQLVHDGHFVFYPDSVTSIFSFGRSTPLVSISLDGKSAPQPYVYADIVAASFQNGTWTPSAIVEIDGQDAIDYLLVWSEYGSLQDPDALYNNLFYVPAQVALGPSGTGTGTFNGGGRGRWPYPGPTTTLKFANGSSLASTNYANVLRSFDGIVDGATLYQQLLAVDPSAYYNVFEYYEEVDATRTTASATGTATPSAATSATSIPAPAYPTPFVQERVNQNSGYFIDEPGYEDVAVLAVRSFVGSLTDEIPFQAVNTYFLEQAAAQGKKKLIIDVSANGGGTILQGYDLFKQLFPSLLPYGATRFKAHDAFNLLGEQDSYLASLLPRSLSNNATWLELQSAVFSYQTDATIDYQPFDSWAEKYGPFEYGPEQESYTPIIRWNLSDVLTPLNSGGIYVSGYLNRSNITTSIFAPENIVIVSAICSYEDLQTPMLPAPVSNVNPVVLSAFSTLPENLLTRHPQLSDGYCASTCTIFSELMRQQGDIKTVALGGRPSRNADAQPIIQAVGGVKGTNDFSFDVVFGYTEEIYAASNASLQAYWQTTVLSNYTALPLARSTTMGLNVRDGIREGDSTGLPLQFRYEAADCRILYTPAMVVDETAVWKTVADSVWGGGLGNACTAGGFIQQGNASLYSRDADVAQIHTVRTDVDSEEILASFGTQTEQVTHRQGYMIP